MRSHGSPSRPVWRSRQSLNFGRLAEDARRFPILALVFACACTATVYAEEGSIARVERMPNSPEPYELRDWSHVAGAFVDAALVTNQPLPSYVGRKGGPEALCLIAAVISGAQAGRDMRTFRGQDWVRLCDGFFSPEDGVCSNNMRGRTGGSFWYDVFANVLYCQLSERYSRSGSELRQIADRLLHVSDFDHTAFDFHAMSPADNGKRTEPEGGAGIAWIEYAAWQTFKEAKYLEAAERAVRTLEARPVEKSPLYEILLPYGALTAARLRAEHGAAHDVGKWVGWCFDPAAAGARPHWGVIADRFGDYDCHGLVGSVRDTDGYAFAMNTYQWAGALVPLARYDARYARSLGKWMLNLCSAARLFYPAALPAGHQDNRAWSEANDPASCIGYEGLRKHPPGKAAPSPYATGDAMRGGAPLNLCLYGSAHVGILAALVRPTGVDKILQLDCLATDYYRQPAFPTFLFYNPHSEAKEVAAPRGRLYDAVTHRFLDRLSIPPDGACLIVVTPESGTFVRRGGRALVNDIVIDYAAK
jgi:hypothetical protein